nr:hypothetical protein [uncultured Mediterranean phage uvMED]
MAAIEDAIAAYQASLDQVQEEFVNDVKAMEEEGLSTTEILGILAAIDITTYIIEDLGASTGIGAYMAATSNILDDLPFFGSVTEAQLVALEATQRSTIVQYTANLGQTMRNEILLGTSTGMSGDAIKARIARNVSLNPSRIDAVLGTTLANYQQAVIFSMAEDMPGDTKFWYVGPLDSKTRPLCRELLGASPMTKQDYESQYPGVLQDRGGVNCRHSIQPVSSNKTLVGTRNKARNEIKDLKSSGKYKKPKTLKQYYESNK